ncbi:tetratricopeptide repeat protein [Blastopirellula sp. J2-11]|uniref:tetratricopeptide repeat protein n=1 Tax=Blastopirellula sp. J2-11 TaxID=2943192 RepID=UPI0021C6EE95|nr:tetratricopeptide repeat protein [Blastopirellula sp. J2-11]UUO08519.1 tetratricopeptide repeat protein [Blastopirellula sp. J2-11]
MCSNLAPWLIMAFIAVVSMPSDAAAQDLRGTPNGKYNNHPASNYPSSGYVDSYLGGASGSRNNYRSHGHRGYSSSYYGRGSNFGYYGPGYSFSSYSGYYPGYGYGYGLPPYGGLGLGGWSPNYYQSTVTANYISPYGVYYRPSDNYSEYYLPPFEPAELRWGAGAIKQFSGVDRNFAMGPLLSENLTDLPNPTYPTLSPALVRMALGERQAPGLPEASLPIARERAARYVGFGDRLFKEQRIHEAMAKYRDAVAAAPDLAAPQFRLGLGYLATGRMEEAAEAFKRGMQLEPSYIFTTNFTLEELYAGFPLAKNSLLEGIARRTLNDPNNADNLFDVGVVLYLDGQIDTARKYFATSRNRLSGADDSHLRPFLVEAGPVTAPQGGLDL